MAPEERRVVVIGGGMAAARLVQRLGAAARPGLALTVIGEEPCAPYNRVLLAEVLAGRYAPEVIALPEPAAAFRRGVRALRVDRADRVVLCDDGQRIPYDTLVLATGSNPVLPALRGLGHGGLSDGRCPDGRCPDGGLPEGVHPFRTLADCRALATAACPGVRAVVIGGGLLGVSAARGLAERGVQVVLVQQGERLMERQLDAGAAELLHDHLTGLGVEVHTQCRVRGLRTEVAGAAPGTAAVSAARATSAAATAADASAAPAVRGVILADGYELAADLVVLACGVRPRTGLATAAGLTVRTGVVVDDTLRTCDPRIHAIGDCAEHRGVVYGLAGPALEQADVLADHLTGRPARYTGTRALTRLTLNGSGPLDLAAFGETDPAPGDEVIRLSDATRRAYRKVVVRGDRLVGGILLGDLAAVGALARAWEGDEPLPSTPPLHLLTTDGGC
ncbi:FAD-dependent oxidoreductase [Streptomyces sp. MST-110588]|uniref:NAD(P)/FAD-dependent oxidoreductase n=1 Tax=Streptomyces sp. MST-110588 TaxID=2833628 RepID=UPI001F5E33FF|nr:FAD-dependent oxidoreductase [Streptomyces sp. MST-110588]UNO42101.1 NAD(P)/FAD-dependent oxidoreductase [Streptomyces sp. MST-110588]